MEKNEERILRIYNILNPLWIFEFPNEEDEIIKYYSFPPFKAFHQVLKVIQEGKRVIVTDDRNAKMIFNGVNNAKVPITYSYASEHSIDISDYLSDI